ncbi:MAG: metallophosphoesterase [Alphaproteobacteria bacterium]|nr:metallophosphoesterase [Alphaproteobacteria bacterium]
MHFTLIASLVGCFTTTYLYFRYAWCCPSVNVWQRTIILAVLLSIVFFPMLASYKFEQPLGKYYITYRETLYIVFVSMVMLFTFTVFRDVVWLILHFINEKYHPITSNNLGKINLYTTIISIIFGLFSYYSGNSIPKLKTFEIKSEKIVEAKNVLMMSDLHIHRALRISKLKGIVEKANKLNPDVIVLVGDIFDDDIDRINDYLNIVKNLKAKKGVYVVTGNHEYYIGYGNALEIYKRMGWNFLENSGVSVYDDLYIGGVPDMTIVNRMRMIKDANLGKTFDDSKDSQYKILLSHTPTNFKDNNFDLELSGHTHGGQIFPFTAFVLLQTRYIAGWFNLSKKARLYVSRGTGQWGPQQRFLAPSEMTMFKFIK